MISIIKIQYTVGLPDISYTFHVYAFTVVALLSCWVQVTDITMAIQRNSYLNMI